MTCLSVPSALEGRFGLVYFSPGWWHPPWKFTVYAQGKRSGAAFLRAPSQHEAVRCYSGFSSASPVKCCRILKLNIVENAAATLRY